MVKFNSGLAQGCSPSFATDARSCAVETADVTTVVLKALSILAQILAI